MKVSINTQVIVSQFKISILTLVILTNFIASEMTFAAKKSKETILMAFFRANGQDGVYLASSEDGLKFTSLNNDEPVMKPAAWEGQNLTRDPSIIYHDGLFHMTWTTNWKGNCFGYATSKDLKTWSDPIQVFPYTDSIKPKLSWAPEICWDPYQKNFMIIWSTNYSARGHQLFISRTSDGKTFSKGQLFLDRPFATIDGMLALDEKNKRWIMIYKNELKEVEGGKNLHVASSPLDFSKPWEDLCAPIVGPGTSVYPESMCEGPSLLKMGKEWFLYWDSPLTKTYTMATSKNLTEWKLRTEDMSFPKGVRHGTIFKAPISAIGWMIK